jgi:hypothetical protein
MVHFNCYNVCDVWGGGGGVSKAMLSFPTAVLMTGNTKCDS